MGVDDEESTYDEVGVQILVEIEASIKDLLQVDWDRGRRCQMIRGALEGQIEHMLPPASMRVVELLCDALITAASLINSDTARLQEQISLVMVHVKSRSSS
jgi:hypothetical protein